MDGKITRYEKIKQLGFDDMVKFLCYLSEGYCDGCVAFGHCAYKHKGFIDWLTEEVEEDEDLCGYT